MDYEKLKEVIAKKIKENGRGEITGPILQAVLMAMVDCLGEVYPQTYTDEQKAQARANIDALSNYDGAITKEKLSAEVQDILADVPKKQNITDATLETTSKEVVGAINELFNKVANLGPYTDNNKDLRSPNLPKGLWYMENLGGFTNVPSAFDINGPVILISTDNRIALFGCEKGSYGFSQYAWRERNTSYWLSGYQKYEEIFVKSENFLSDAEINTIWNNN